MTPPFRCLLRRAWALALLVLLAPASANATDYYINHATGNDSNAGTSPSAPWKNVGKITTTVFSPGDTIHLARGQVWSLTNNNSGVNVEQSGTAGAPITIKPYGDPEDGPPTIENPAGYSGMTPPYTGTNITIANRRRGMTIKGSYIVVEGLRFRNINYAGIYIDNSTNGGNHNIIRDCEITDCGVAIVIQGKDSPAAGQYNLITGNFIHSLRIQHATNYAPSDPATVNDDVGAIGISLHASNNEIAHNVLVNCKAACADFGGVDGGAFEFFPGPGRSVSGNYIHHNYVEGCDGVLEVGSGDSLTIAADNRIANNVCVDNNGKFAYLHFSGGWSTQITGLRFEGNTVLDASATSGTLIGYNGDPWDSSAGASRVILRGNLFHSSRPVTYNWSGSPNTRFDTAHNLFSRTSGAIQIALGPGDKNAAPAFVTGTLATPAPGSPAIDAGIDLGDTLDGEGNPRLVGAAPDIGAIEAQAAPAYDEPFDDYSAAELVHRTPSVWSLDSSNASFMEGDASRARRSANNGPGEISELVFDLGTLRNFHLRVFSRNDYNLSGKLKFLVSPDNVAYSEVAATKGLSQLMAGSNWYKAIYTPADALPAGGRYLKIQLIGETDYVWNPQLSRLVTR